MEALTNFSQFAELTSRLHTVWILDTAINGLLVFVSCYLLMALIFYQLKVEQPRKERFFSLSVEQKYGVLSKYVCILFAVASFLRQSTSFAGLWIDFYIVNYNLTVFQESMIDPACYALPLLFNFATSIGGASIFLFLWFRQRIFYIHPSLKILSNSCLKCLSVGIIFVWAMFFISLYPAFIILVRYHYKEKIGCIIKEETFDSYTYIILCWAAMSIFMQILLLFLFIYPILKRSAWISQQRNKQDSDALTRRVKKAIILALIALATDILSTITNILLGVGNVMKPRFEFSLNLVVNHLVTIACFDYWRQLLWPWNLKSKSRSKRNVF